MNITDSVFPIIIAKTCESKDRKSHQVTYALTEESLDLCHDKKDLLQAELQACETLLTHTKENSEREAIQREISELKMTLDLLT
jgi:hypothetical protein